jgi:hypothetical protein
MKPQRALTFNQMLDKSRVECAITVWDRAKIASLLRHKFATSGNHRGARLMAALKARCLERVVQIIPKEVHITIDHDYQVGLVSVRWFGHGRLHLPAGSFMNRSA